MITQPTVKNADGPLSLWKTTVDENYPASYELKLKKMLQRSREMLKT